VARTETVHGRAIQVLRTEVHLVGALDWHSLRSELLGKLVRLLRGGVRTILRSNHIDRIRVLIGRRRHIQEAIDVGAGEHISQGMGRLPLT
jgi:hypothetical protein